MSQGTGPALAPVGNEPISPEAASELERAATALDGMAQQVEGLMADLKKEQAPPAISLEAEEGITAANTLLEVSTRSASLAKALEDAQQPDMTKLAKEAGVKIVPVAHNAGDFWQRRELTKRPGTIRFCIGPPIDAADREPRETNLVVQAWIENKMREISHAHQQPEQGNN